MATLSDIFTRLRIAWAAGMQANGARNLYSTYGWKPALSHADFVAKYNRQDITQRIIKAPVNALWADPPKIVSSDQAFSAAWQNLLAKTPVFHELQRVDILAGLGRFAILVVGLNDGKKLSDPVSRGSGRQVTYLQPYAEGSVEIRSYEQDSSSPRFGLPTVYRVSPGAFELTTNLNASGASNVVQSFEVHHSRVLHVAEGALESNVFGHSRLEAVYNVLDDILKLTGGSAEMFWLSANRGLHIDVDKDVEMKQDDADNLAEEIDEYENELRRVIRTRGVKINSLGSEVADPRGVFDVQMSLLAAATGIPKRVLMGSEAGQLASQQDRANWATRVEERITSHGQPTILIPFIRLLIDSGVLPPPKNLSIEWPDAFKMNPLERAQTSAQMARSAANLAKTLKTVQDINTAGAENARPTIESATGGGGFMGNAAADPQDTSTDQAQSGGSGQPAQQPQKGYGSASKDITKAPPGQIMRPPLIPEFKPLVLLTEEECRSIIGFGKHMPVFDEASDSQASGVSDSSQQTLDFGS